MDEAVIGIVLNSDRKIVLTKRADTPIWVLPGGGIDQGETPEQAIIREIEEETGLKSTIRYKCAEYLPVNSFAAKTHLYVCDICGGGLQISSETEEVKMFEEDKLPYPFFLLHQAWLQDWKNYNGFIIKKEITQINLYAIIMFFIRHPIIFLKFVTNKRLKKRFSND